MTRISFHGPRRPPPKVSPLRKVYETLFPPKPIVFQTLYFPHHTSGAVPIQALHRAHAASQAGARKTAHYSAPPRTNLERKVVLIGGTVVAACVGYWALSRDYVVITNRERTMGFSWSFERANFGSRKKDEASDAKSHGTLLSPEKDIRAEVVQEIARRIFAVMEKEFPEVYKQLNWEAELRQNPAVNAFYQPGGRLIVCSGLVSMVAKAESEGKIESAIDALAMVIAHEVAHGMARHGMEKLSWLPIQLPFLMLTPDVDVLWQSFNLVFKLPHNRLLETEADIIGLRLMASAGFNPSHAPDFFKILNTQSKVFEWTSTHPVGETRASEVSALLASEPDFFRKGSTDSQGYEWPDLKAYYLKSKRDAEGVTAPK